VDRQPTDDDAAAVGGDVEHTLSDTREEHCPRGCQSLLLLAFLMSTDGIIRNDGVAH
jgi:hypothetical protein